MLAPKIRPDPVNLVLNMVNIALVLLRDPEADKSRVKQIPSSSHVLLLQELDIIIAEYRYMRLEGGIIPYEALWENDEKFGEIMHKCMHEAHHKYFSKCGSRDEIYVLAKKVLKAISHTPPEIPEGEDINRLIGFFRHMKNTAESYREKRMWRESAH